MSQENFDRIAILKVFQTETAHKAGTDPGAMSLIKVDHEGSAFSSRMQDGSPGFRIKFSVDKITQGTMNSTSIFIYNLGYKSRALFEKINNIIELSAGYGDQSEVIYHGNILRTRTTKEGVDYVTQIEAADGLFAFQNSKIDISFRPGVKKSQIINTLTGQLEAAGVGISEIKGLPTDGYNHGIVLSGKVVDCLMKICNKEGLQFSIQDGAVKIIPNGEGSDDAPVLVTPDTGLIGIPEQREIGISFKCLMNAKIKPFRKVSVMSKFLRDPVTNKTLSALDTDGRTLPGAALYNAIKVKHTGDSFGGDWYTNVEAV